MTSNIHVDLRMHFMHNQIRKFSINMERNTQFTIKVRTNDAAMAII